MFSHLDLNNGRISDVLPKNMYVSHSVLPDLVHCISLRLDNEPLSLCPSALIEKNPSNAAHEINLS